MTGGIAVGCHTILLLGCILGCVCKACSELSGLTEHEQSVMQSVTSDSVYGFSLRLACEAVGTA